MINESWDNLPHEAKELILHGDNSGSMGVHNSVSDIRRNLKKKMASGKYDSEKAKDLWKYHADLLARDYTQAYGGRDAKWHELFNTGIRKKVADHYEKKHRESLKEEVETVGNLIESIVDKKPTIVEDLFGKLILNKITNLVNEKREQVKKVAFGAKKEDNDNAVHASIDGE